MKAFNIFQEKFLIIVCLIFFIGFYFRISHSELYTFNFDQVQILTNAEKILTGDLSLVGPRTGPAQIFTGPIIYYLAALFFKFCSIQVTIIATISFCYIFSFVLIFFMISRYLEKKQSCFYLIIYALSPYLVSLDRTMWNPNLIFIASNLIFLPLIAYFSNYKFKFVDYFFLFLGGFFSYQAHFSTLLLIPLLLLILLIYKKINLKIILSAISGLLLSLIPTIIFDLHHDFYNLQGFFELLFRNEKNISIFARLLNIFHHLYITFENFTKFIFIDSHNYWVYLIIFFFIVFTYRYRNDLKKYIPLQISLLWLLLICFFYIFYTGPKPEYYFMIQFPAILFILITFISKVSTHHYLVFLTILLVYFASNFSLFSSRSLALGEMLEVKASIQKLTHHHKIKLILNTDAALGETLSYLFKDIPQQDNGRNLYLIHPYNNDSPFINKFAHVAIWLEPEKEEGKNYFQYHELLLESADTIEVYINAERKDYSSIMTIFQNNIKLGDLIIIARKENNNLYDQLDKIENTGERIFPSWVVIKDSIMSGLVRKDKDLLLIFQPSANLNFKKFEPAIESVKIKQYQDIY